MNILDALDILGPLAIALGTMPIAAGVARFALKVLTAAMISSGQRMAT